MNLKNKIILSVVILLISIFIILAALLFFILKKNFTKNRLIDVKTIMELYKQEFIYLGIIENKKSLSNIAELINKSNYIDFIKIEKNNKIIFFKVFYSTNSPIIVDKSYTIKTLQKPVTIRIIFGANINDFVKNSKDILYCFILSSLILIILFSLLVSLLLSKYFNVLSQISEALEQVPENKFKKIDLPIYEEIRPIINSYNKMIDSLKEKDEKIKHHIKEISNKNEELKKRLAEISALQKMLIMKEKLAGLGTIVAGVAHEINNPVAAIRGLCELYVIKYNQDKKMEKIFKKIIGYCDRISGIVRKLKAYGKPISNEKSERCKLSDIIKDAIEMENFNKILENIRIKGNYKNSNIQVLCKKDELLQVFINLLTNSVEAMNGKGEIIIDIFNNNGYVEVHYLDSGPGIPEEIKDKIFDPFYTTKKNGTGLGLYIVYKIIKNHNGDIFLKDSSKGVYFVIKLPELKKLEVC